MMPRSPRQTTKKRRFAAPVLAIAAFVAATAAFLGNLSDIKNAIGDLYWAKPKTPGVVVIASAEITASGFMESTEAGRTALVHVRTLVRKHGDLPVTGCQAEILMSSPDAVTTQIEVGDDGQSSYDSGNSDNVAVFKFGEFRFDSDYARLQIRLNCENQITDWVDVVGNFRR